MALCMLASSYVHNLFVCRADTDKVVAFRTVSAPSVDERLSTAVGELDPGEYDVRVVAVASAEGSRGMSNPSPPARYVTATSAASRSVAYIAPVVVGSIIGVLLGVFFSSSIILTGEKLSVVSKVCQLTYRDICLC